MLERISEKIEEKSSIIIEKLIKNNSVHDYLNVRKLFNEDDILGETFQKAFNNFYGLNRFMKSKETFYSIFNSCKKTGSFDLVEILVELQKSTGRIEYSFVSKMCHTLDNNMPIYDDNIAKTFGFDIHNYADMEIKIDRFLLFLEELKNSYSSIITNNFLEKTIKQFDESFPLIQISEVKKIDFIIWTYGSKN
jgi:hypothetical protein